MLVAKNVGKIFKQGFRKVPAVENVDLCIEKGECIFIHGPSGAGKSTLLHMLGALARPTKGTVFFRGRDVYKLNDRKRSRLRNTSFGFIFQFYHLLPELNVMDNVMLPAKIKGGSGFGKARERAEELLRTVNMAHRLKHRPGELSGGEIQRTAIARALINSPDVLFCDEPTGNLDSHMREEVYALIKKVSSKNDMSVLIVSHQDVDRSFYDKAYCMTDGILSAESVSGETAADKVSFAGDMKFFNA